MGHIACIHTHCSSIFLTFGKWNSLLAIFSGAWSLSGVTKLDDFYDIRPVSPCRGIENFHAVHSGLYYVWEVLIKTSRVE